MILEGITCVFVSVSTILKSSVEAVTAARFSISPSRTQSGVVDDKSVGMGGRPRCRCSDREGVCAKKYWYDCRTHFRRRLISYVGSVSRCQYPESDRKIIGRVV